MGAQEKVLRPCSGFGVFSPRGRRCRPLRSGKSLQPTGVVREGEGTRETPFALLLQLDTHTPRRHSKLRRQSPQRAAGRALPLAAAALRQPEPRGAERGESPARCPPPGAAAPKPGPAAQCKDETFPAGKSERGAGARTRNAHPLRPERNKKFAPPRLTHAVFLVLRRYPHGWRGLPGLRAL